MASVIEIVRKFGVCAMLLLSASTELRAQDLGRIPLGSSKITSEKTQEASATAGKSLQGPQDSTKSKSTSRFRNETKDVRTEVKQEPVDLNMPAKSAQPKITPRTLNEDSRDPFRPATLRKKVTARPRENLSPLERFELNQLKIVGVIWDMKEPRAMVEDSTGLGYTIKVGTPIGSNDGLVKVIHRNEIVVEEFYYDVYGVRKKREVSMKLLTE